MGLRTQSSPAMADLPPAAALWALVRKIAVLALIGLACLAPLQARAGNQFLQPDKAFRFDARLGQGDTLILRWIVAPGYHLYRDRIKLAVAPSSVQLAPYRLPAGTWLDDPAFGRQQVYEGTVTLTVPFRVSGPRPTALQVKSDYQGCANAGVCYAPLSKTVSLTLPPAGGPAVAPSPGGTEPPALVTHARSLGNGAGFGGGAEGRYAEALQGRFWLTLGLFFLAGIGLAFTPCIFPMIPILSAIVVGQGHAEPWPGSSRRRAFLLSLAYVRGMSLTYTAAGVLAGLTGAYLQAAFQNPWVLGGFAALFVVLALSMFGFYELQMPASIQSRLSRFGKGGHLAGTFILGALSALIVGPCVAAPLAGALLYISQTGDVLLGGISLFVLALGMGLPLLVIGSSAGHFLPRAGAWMETIKAVFGVALLGVAIWLLSRIVPAPATLGLWAALAVVSAVYLGALDRLERGATGWRRFWKGVGILLLGYGLALGAGALSGARNPLAPLARVVGPSEATTPEPAFRKVGTPEELQEALAAARGRPVLVDFWASWCVECRQMDAHTFQDPKVQEALRGYALIRVDVTANDAATKALLKRYGLIGPPAILLFDAQGREAGQYVGYEGPKDLLGHLQKVQP